MRLLGVLAGAVVSDLATGLGAVPLALKRQGRAWLGVSNAVAAGAMAAAGAGVALEGYDQHAYRTFLGAAFGIALMTVLRWLLAGREPEWGSVRRRDAAQLVAIVAVMTLHSFTEGIAIGVSFGDGQPLGLYITAAMTIHNIPEGLAISLVMVPRGTPVRVAAFWSIFSSLPQPLMAVPAYLLVEHFRPLLPLGLGFAAGAMLWMVIAELMPESLRHTSVPRAAAGFAASASTMAGLQVLLA